MKIQLTSVFVDDPLGAFKFYTEVLGFRERLFMPDANLAIVASPEDPDGTGLLLEPSENPVAKTYQEGVYRAGLPVIVFSTPDVQREYARLSNLGVVFRGPPTPTEAGLAAVFDDTCGNLVQLYQAQGETVRANGTFEVKLQPLEPYAAGQAGVSLGRMSLDKTFSGDLRGTSRGEMLSAMSSDARGDAAGYVALEQVSGTLAGREGTFVLQHCGVSGRGGDRLVLGVLPGSGTGALAELTGEMTIRREDGEHFYSLEYTLPEA